MEMDADDIFVNYLSCKYKGYLTLQGEKGELSEYGLLQTRLRQDYKNAATSTIICNNQKSLIPRNSPLTIADLKQGAPFIVNVAIEHKSVMCRLDALKRVDGQSLLASFYYAPVAFSESDIVGKHIERLLTLGSLLLSHVQKTHSNIGIVVSGPEHKSKILHLGKYGKGSRQIVTPTYISRHTQIS